MLRIFLNTGFSGTKPKEAAYPVTVLKSKTSFVEQII
jgi:hypothetical protein